MKGYSPKEVIKILQKNNQYEKRVRGSHHIFANKDNSKIVVVPTSKKIVPIGTLKNIEKQSDIKFEQEVLLNEK